MKSFSLVQCARRTLHINNPTAKFNDEHTKAYLQLIFLCYCNRFCSAKSASTETPSGGSFMSETNSFCNLFWKTNWFSLIHLLIIDFIFNKLYLPQMVTFLPCWLLIKLSLDQDYLYFNEVWLINEHSICSRELILLAIYLTIQEEICQIIVIILIVVKCQ